MSSKTTILDVTLDNIADHPQVICFINPKHAYYPLKIDWLRKRYRDGLKTKLLYLEDVKRPIGFIETIPGEYAWRAVSAEGTLFIHCLWTNGKKFQHQGLGRELLKAAEKDAVGKSGVAVVTSDGSFMANKDLFLKNGYEVLDESGADQLLFKRLNPGPAPSINDWNSELAEFKGKRLTIVYSKQCPWVARFIEECRPILKKENLDVTVIELQTAADAQKGPSLYGVFNLIYDGRLLADRYISTTRFQNIINKEIHKE